MLKQHTLVNKICIHNGLIRPTDIYAWAMIGKLPGTFNRAAITLCFWFFFSVLWLSAKDIIIVYEGLFFIQLS